MLLRPLTLAPTLSLTLASVIATLPVNSVEQNSAPGQVEVETSIDRLEATIGDVFTLSISVVYDSSVQISTPELGKTVDTFEVQGVAWGEEIVLEDGRKSVTGEVRLWALDEGRYEIPALEIPYVDTLGSPQFAQTSSFAVTVTSNLGGEADSALLKPLLEPLPNPLGLTANLTDRTEFWISLGAALALAGLALWVLIRRRRAELAWIDTRPAWEKAFERLAALRNTPYLVNSQHKAYYSELTVILKEFLGRVTAAPAPDMTTGELLAASDTLALLSAHKETLRSVLVQADMVKFARQSPAPEKPERDFETTYSLVQTIRDDTLKRDEEKRRLAEQMDASDNTAAASSSAAEVERAAPGGSDGSSRGHRQEAGDV
ncbi:MAG: hypothetical protein ACE5GA_09005 [Candidatus Zixiibacteriota bacterium]